MYYYVLNVTLVRQKMSTNGATFLVLLLCWSSVGPDILATTTGYGRWGLSARVAGMVHYKLGTMGRPGVAVASRKRNQKLAAKYENKEIDELIVAGRLSRWIRLARTGLRRGLDDKTAPTTFSFLPGLAPLRFFLPRHSSSSSALGFLLLPLLALLYIPGF